MPQPLFPVQRQAKQDGYLHGVFPAGKYGLLARQFPVGQTAKKPDRLILFLVQVMTVQIAHCPH
ncbi:hypothetical protein PK04_02650 [Salmonella enterica subsp. enterica]|nr:hypothetical protein [Salmonella enterica subsp. enterica]